MTRVRVGAAMLKPSRKWPESANACTISRLMAPQNAVLHSAQTPLLGLNMGKANLTVRGMRKMILVAKSIQTGAK